MSITGNIPGKSIELAEVEFSNAITEKKISCPYCQSSFADKDILSKHIDRLHLGSGLLEGDMRQW